MCHASCLWNRVVNWAIFGIKEHGLDTHQEVFAVKLTFPKYFKRINNNGRGYNDEARALPYLDIYPLLPRARLPTYPLTHLPKRLSSRIIHIPMQPERITRIEFNETIPNI